MAKAKSGELALVTSVVAGTMPQDGGTTQPVATTFKVVSADGSFREFTETPLFKAGVDVVLDCEGVVTFVDVNDKKQAARKEKLIDPKGDGSRSRCHPSVLFYSDNEKKYGGIVACLDCSKPVRKWTSDMHQSERCDPCGVRAKRAHAKAKRSAKSSESVPGAMPSMPAPTS